MHDRNCHSCLLETATTYNCVNKRFIYGVFGNWSMLVSSPLFCFLSSLLSSFTVPWKKLPDDPNSGEAARLVLRQLVVFMHTINLRQTFSSARLHDISCARCINSKQIPSQYVFPPILTRNPLYSDISKRVKVPGGLLLELPSWMHSACNRMYLIRAAWLCRLLKVKQKKMYEIWTHFDFFQVPYTLLVSQFCKLL